MTGLALTESLELLLGDGDPKRIELGRRVTTAIRLLLANTRESRSPSAAVQGGSAREELQSHRMGRLGDRLRDLLAHLSSAGARPCSFLRFEAPSDSYTDTWAALLALVSSADRARLGLDVPHPGEAGHAGILGVLAVHREHGMSVPGGLEELRHHHWRARVQWTLDGAAQPFLDVLRRIAERARHLGESEARSLLDGIIGDTLAVHLDLGSVATAMEMVESLGWAPDAAASAPSALSVAQGGKAHAGDGQVQGKGGRSTQSLARAYAAMVSWLQGATDVIPDWSGGSSPWGRNLAPRWTRLLRSVGSPSVAPSSEDPPGATSGVARGPLAGSLGSAHPAGPSAPKRREFAARAIVIRVFHRASGLRLFSADVAPALQDSLSEWERSRQFAASEPGSPEHLMVGAGSGSRAIAEFFAQPFRFGIAAGNRAPLSVDPADIRGPLAVVCEPLLDQAGELSGCLWMEFDHRLLPSEMDIAAAARRAESVLVSAGSVSGGSVPGGSVSGAQPPRGALLRTGQIPSTGQPAERQSLGHLGAAWERLMDRLLVKTQERRWAAFHWNHAATRGWAGPESGALESLGSLSGTHPDGPGGEIICAGSGGDGDLGDWTNGAEAILRRSLTAAAAIRYGRNSSGKVDPGDVEAPREVGDHLGNKSTPPTTTPIGGTSCATFFSRAVQGASIPLVSEGMVIGALVVESTRRGDLGGEDVQRWFEALRAAAAELELALVHGRDAQLGEGGGLALDMAAPDAIGLFHRVRALSRARSDVLILGELGSGRRTMARAVHHLGAAFGKAGTLQSVNAFGLSAAELERHLAKARDGSLVLGGVEALDHAGQGVLAKWLEAPLDQRSRLLVTAKLGLPEGSPDALASAPEGGSAAGRRQGRPKGSYGGPRGGEPLGGLSFELQLECHQLATSLTRAVLRVEPLRRRRHWIPSLVRATLAKIAGRESRAIPVVDDEAMALLWRQPWPGNVLDLEAVLYGAFLGPRDEGGNRLSTQDLSIAFGELRVEVTGRLASRDPNLVDLAAAVWTTRTGSGRINKTRAALYLGWDPATLTARIREAEWDGLGAAMEVLS